MSYEYNGQVQERAIICDCLVLCEIVPYAYDPQRLADILATVTGWRTSTTELLRVAERTLTRARLFNIREGFSAADDKLPNRFFQPKRNRVLSTKFYDSEQLERAKSYYYTLMGWNTKTGIPTPEKLQELGIE